MAPSERARKNHDFPGQVSSLAVTDPELIETFDNFAFDEVLQHSELDVRTRLMVQLAAIIACQALREYRLMLGAALTLGITPVEAKEILYQAVAYVGMAKVYDFIHATNEVLTERGVKLPLPGLSTTTPGNRAEKGLAVQSRSSATMSPKSSTRRHPTTCCTSSAIFRPTASATITHAPASMFPRPSFSPSACSPHLADANRRSRATSPPTSRSVTTADVSSMC